MEVRVLDRFLPVFLTASQMPPGQQQELKQCGTLVVPAACKKGKEDQ